MFYAVIFLRTSKIADIAFFWVNEQLEPEEIISSKVCAFHCVYFLCTSATSHSDL